MNNALRYWGQRYAVSWLERLGGKVNGGRVLEVGCGRGVGVQMILERFGAAWVEAIDLDPKMIEHARRRLASYGSTRVRLSVGNLTSIHAQNGTFDAVFDFGAIHLEPDWRQGIAEVRRVLSPMAGSISSGSQIDSFVLRIHWSRKASVGWNRRVQTS
jgi:ubiquinone/menaquinone biosynthesis C-methylase UbiE